MKVLFVHNWPTEFVKIDRDLLSRQFVLREVCNRFDTKRPLTMWSDLAWADVIVCWFASWHAYLPAVFARASGKPIVLVVGGYDTANAPEIQYGHQRGGLKKLVGSWIIRQASLLVVNSQYSADEVRANIPNVRCPIRVVYHGVPDLFGDVREQKAFNRVITVGNVNESNLLRKGMKWFCEASRFLPEAEFVLAGRHVDNSIAYLRSVSPGNVRFTGFLSTPELTELYRSASVYVQPSRHEAFGMSVAEAMLAGCIPVVSHFGALPEVVGNCGIVLADCNPQTVAAGIREAMSASTQQRLAARQRILTVFPVDRRRQALVAAITDSASANRLAVER